MEQLQALVPEAKWPLVESALRTAFGDAKVESARLLTGGLSSALVYYIRIQGTEYVLRLILQRDAIRDPVRHFRCLSLAAEAGIAPPVRYLDSEAGLSISRFIQGMPPPFPPGFWLALVEVITSIHALPLFPPLVGFLDGVDGLIAQFRSSALLPPEATAEYFELYSHIQRVYPRHDTDLVSSHNDLNPGNLLHDGQKIWVIDWEAAFANDRYVDLAVAANFFNADEAKADAMLQAYFGAALGQYQADRFFLMRQVCRIYNAMLFLSATAAMRPTDTIVDAAMETPTWAEFVALMHEGKVAHTSWEGSLMFGKVMLNEALAAMRTPRFEVAIRQMEIRSEARNEVPT